MLVSEMIARAARTFQDEGYSLIRRDEWLDYINEFLLDYAGRTEQFRTRKRLNRGYNPWCLELPANLITLLWAAFDGETLELTSYKELEQKDRKFMERTGTPTHAFRDLAGVTQLRLWPTPVWEDDDLTQFRGTPDDWDGNDLAGSLVDRDTGVIRAISDSENTYRFVQARPAGGGVTVPATTDAEYGHIVALIRTDSPATPPGQSGGDPGFTSYASGKIIQLVTSNVEIAFSYVPEMPSDEPGQLAAEIPFQDQNEMAGTYYLLFRAYSKSIETGDAQKAEYYRQLYEERVAQGIRKKSDTWSARRRKTIGRYF